MTGLFSFPAYAQFQHPAAGIHKDEVIVSIAGMLSWHNFGTIANQ